MKTTKVVAGMYRAEKQQCTATIEYVDFGNGYKGWTYRVVGEKESEISEVYDTKRECVRCAEDFIDRAVYVNRLGWCLR